MAAAGCALHEDLTKLAVMWFLHALLNIHKFWTLASKADRYFRHHRPDAVVLIDYPGFNWWIARRAKAHGFRCSITACRSCGRGWLRIRKMRRFVDYVLCKLPFEETWYRERGCKATFVGHSVLRSTAG
jgi:lipid-A-disaccharide synthase